MGVMLALDRHQPARGRRRPGQHARHPGDRERAQALATVRRGDAPAGGRLFGRLARTVLPRKGAPVAVAGTAGPGRGLASSEPAARPGRSRYPGLSVACLLGDCRDGATRPPCDADGCEHDCHRRGLGSGAGTSPAA